MTLTWRASCMLFENSYVFAIEIYDRDCMNNLKIYICDKTNRNLEYFIYVNILYAHMEIIMYNIITLSVDDVLKKYLHRQCSSILCSYTNITSYKMCTHVVVLSWSEQRKKLHNNIHYFSCLKKSCKLFVLSSYANWLLVITYTICSQDIHTLIATCLPTSR